MFIDGDHTYQGVKQDFQMYSPRVRKGGLVAFHDIATHDHTSGCEEDKFWNEIKPSYRNLEIIEKQDQKWAEIGGYSSNQQVWVAFIFVRLKF